MNYKNYILAVISLICLAGCRSISVNKTAMHTATTTPIALGVIGIHENHILNTDFQVTTIPTYKKAIRTGITTTNFDKATYKAYLAASQHNAQQITYVDSLDNKPQFLKIELIDWVTTIAELEEAYNQQTIEYLKRQEDAEIISSVSMAVSQDMINEMHTAEAVFLINKNYKQYELSLVKNGKPYKTIDFSDVTIFGYRLSYFCWGENDKRRVTLFDIVDENDNCPKNTYKNAEKAKDKIDYFKL
ncbi:hypothetical protein [Aquimarina sp. 2201CG14-23]|uniref:hypothetical protein n=1 Tax=Aquimarina mycalae TaxID=3040073 RepID=UPI002477DF99|nr:hypothetical protein [Aquimarina sp. 2201CG14-23]MDH7445311.1 hypothetical protein [Aquimarina sp. 2201CG14-23]